MSPIVSNDCTRSALAAALARSLPFSFPRQLITQGLLVALLGMPILTQPPMALAVPQSPDTTKPNPVTAQLLGRWQAKDPTSNKTFTFIFAPNGNLFVVLPVAPLGSSVALKVTYQVNPTTQPMQLDIQLSPEEKASTIFEFTPDGKLRLPLEGLTPGQTRPTRFRPNATLFAKVSDLTTVPENIRVVDYQDFANANKPKPRKPEDEAVTYMSALTQVQQAHYREQGKFASKIEDVSVGLRTETESYRYQFVPQGNQTQSVMITAVAKNPQLSSFTGAVFVTKVNGETTTASQICETDKPSTSAPAMPMVATNGSSKILCPTGSHALR